MSCKNEIVFTPGDKTLTAKLCKGQLSTKIKNFAAVRDDCEILKQTSSYIIARFPVSWLRIIVDRGLNEKERERLNNERSGEEAVRNGKKGGKNE